MKRLVALVALSACGRFDAADAPPPDGGATIPNVEPGVDAGADVAAPGDEGVAAEVRLVHRTPFANTDALAAFAAGDSVRLGVGPPLRALETFDSEVSFAVGDFVAPADGTHSLKTAAATSSTTWIVVGTRLRAARR